MTPEEILQECKQQIAEKYNFPEWGLMDYALTEKGLSSWVVSRMHEVMKLYTQRIAEMFADWVASNYKKFYPAEGEPFFYRAVGVYNVKQGHFKTPELYQLFIKQLYQNL